MAIEIIVVVGGNEQSNNTLCHPTSLSCEYAADVAAKLHRLHLLAHPNP